MKLSDVVRKMSLDNIVIKHLYKMIVPPSVNLNAARETATANQATRGNLKLLEVNS